MHREKSYSINSKADRKQWYPYVCAFLLPSSIMLFVFIARMIYPFGDETFLDSDLYHQYMPFLVEFVRKIKAGESLSYSINVGLGSNFLAIYAYYLASPLNWLAVLVPEAYLVEFLSYMSIVKIGLSGLTCCYYLRKHFATNNKGTIFFACFYALSGFMAAYNINGMWLDSVLLFPLIVLGLEKLVKEGKCGLYCATLALSIFSNFYISIMICIFLVLYFVVLLFEKRSWKILGNFMLYSLLAGGMASILLMPVLCAMLSGNTGEADIAVTYETYFSVFDVLLRHGLCVATERGLNHWPNIYCGVAVFLLLPIYLMNRKIPRKQRLGKLALWGFILLSFCVKMLDAIWHGLYYPDSYPARQSFIYIFLILVMCYEAYEHIEEISKKQIVCIYAGAVVLILYGMIFVKQERLFPNVELVTLVFVSFYAVIIWAYRAEQKAGQREKLLKAMAVILVVECIINTNATTVQTNNRSDYLREIPEYAALYEVTKGREEGFYRLEIFKHRTMNDGVLAGFPTVSVFSSIMNYSVMDTYKSLGMKLREANYGLDGATPFAAALLNVDYMFSRKQYSGGTLHTLLEKSNDIYLFESNYTLPFGYVAPCGYDFPEEIGNDSIGIQNELVQSLGVSEELLIPISGDFAGNEMEYTAEKSGNYYARVKDSDTKKLQTSGGTMDTYLYDCVYNQSILSLGYLLEGEKVVIQNEDEEDDTPDTSLDIFVLNESALEQALEILSKQHMTDVEYGDTHLTGKLLLTEAGRLIMSIPYEKGWTVKINGEEVEPELFGGSLMAFDLEAGEYEISMNYVPEGKYAGIAVTTVSVMLFIVLMIMQRKKAAVEVLHERNETM